MTPDQLRILLLCSLAIPLAAAVVVALLGPNRLEAIRRISLTATLVGLVIVVALAANFWTLVQERQAAQGAGAYAKLTFTPEFVPGARGEGWDSRHETTLNLLPLGSGAIQFYIGIDGINVWLIVLTAILMVSSVLVSWTSITERVNEYYAWLLVLGAGMIGVFLAFDIILFYVFFELTLIPLFFLIGIWGGPQRQHAARKFFIFTLAGSLITFLGLLAIVLVCQNYTGELTFSIPRLVSLVHQQLANNDTWRQVQPWIFLAMMCGFAVKVPLPPLHTWLPLAHVEAPTAGSVLLAGVLLKIGSYGFLRLCVPLTPDASLTVGVPLIGTLAVIGILYGAFCSLAQDDIKKLIAYSSVSHLGFCMLGMFALNAAGLGGSLLQMINHGLSTGALFLLVGMLYERYHTRKMADYGGMAARLHMLGFFMVVTCLSSVGLPGLNGFVGEALVFLGMYDGPITTSRLMAAVGTAGIILGAWYLLTMLRRVFFGPVKEPIQFGEHHVTDLNFRELAALVPLAVLFLVLGIFPQPVLDIAKPDLQVVEQIANRAKDRAIAAAGHALPDAPIAALPAEVKKAQ